MKYTLSTTGTMILILAFCVLLCLPLILQKRAERREAADREAAAIRAAQEKARREREAEQQRAAAERAAAEKRAAAAALAAEKRAAREAAAAEKHAQQVARARELAELAERRLQAEKEAAAIRNAQKTFVSPVQSVPVRTSANAAETFQPVPSDDPYTDIDSAAFQGESVAFTGKIPGYTRAECVKLTAAAGGRGYETINTHCTLLVVGQKPGMCQLDKADNWSIKKITWQEWQERAGLAA